MHGASRGIGHAPAYAALARGRVERVALPGARRCAYLRELRGTDEEAIGGGGTLAALSLLDRLLVEGPGASVRPGGAATLTVTERDRLLAHVYRAIFGTRVRG